MNSQKTDRPGGQPFSQVLHRLREELDRLGEMAWSRGEEMWGQIRHPQADAPIDWTPEVDLVETEEALVVFVNLPGIPVEKTDVQLVGNVLEITDEFDSLTLLPTDRVHRRERPTGKLRRTLTLPFSVDIKSARAHAEHGVLKIEMKKSYVAQTHKVPVVGTETTPARVGAED